MRSKHLLLLRTPSKAADHNDNPAQIEASFKRAGWRVSTASHEALRWSATGLQAAGINLTEPDMVWHLGFGPRTSFLDRMQLLALAPPDRLVTPPVALALYHGKACWLEHAPPTWVSNDARWLANAARDDVAWVAKPTAGSHGDGVAFVDAQSDGASPASERQTVFSKLTQDGCYALAQEQIDGHEDGEIRVLVAGGLTIGSYQRHSSVAHERRHNLALGGRAKLAIPSDEQTRVIAGTTRQLVERRIGYAAIDMIGRYVVEVNVVNPGGLGTLRQLGDEAVSERLVAALDGWPASGVG